MPAKNKGTLNERVSTSFKQLSVAANYLNNTSDALGKAIGSIEEKLRRLNIGLEVWVPVDQECSEETDEIVVHHLGYAGPPAVAYWAISIRTLWIDRDDEKERIVTFNSASRELRLRTIDKIPELIEALTKEVSDKVAEIKPIVDRAEEFAEVLDAVVTGDESDEETN